MANRITPMPAGRGIGRSAMDAIFQFSDDIRFWHWWIFGILLVGLEIIVPGSFFLWMGVAAGVVGLILLIAPDFAWQGQILTFAVFSMVAVGGWRFWLRKHPIQTQDATLNIRGARYNGRVLTLSEPLVNGVGKVKVDDGLWRVSTGDASALPKGARVRVTGVDGATLVVEELREETA